MSVTLCADRVQPGRIDQELVTRMRASVLLLGALLARCGEAQLPMPGGDAIGLRGIDFHLAGLRAMGATVELDGGMIQATAPAGLRGADILLPLPSVGATENLLLAAVLAQGTTTIRNAAREPEIADLATCLIAMGAKVSGLGSHVLTIEGGAPLAGAVHAVLPDRIEFGTLACAAAITDGELVLPHGRVDLLGAAAASLAAAGVELRDVDGGVVARRAKNGLVGVDIATGPYPGFATDLQSPAMALLATATGASAVTETIFEQRFRHVDELRKMGADIAVHGRTALSPRRRDGCAGLPSPAPTCVRQRRSSSPGSALREKRPSTVSTIWIEVMIAWPRSSPPAGRTSLACPSKARKSVATCGCCRPRTPGRTRCVWT